METIIIFAPYLMTQLYLHYIFSNMNVLLYVRQRLRLWTDFADIGVKQSTRTTFQQIFQNVLSNCHKMSGLSFPIPKSVISLLKT